MQKAKVTPVTTTPIQDVEEFHAGELDVLIFGFGFFFFHLLIYFCQKQRILFGVMMSLVELLQLFLKLKYIIFICFIICFFKKIQNSIFFNYPK